VSTKVTDYYETEEAFLELLENATNNSEGDWEESFVQDVTDRFNQYKMGMFLSYKQNAKLDKIANGENE